MYSFLSAKLAVLAAATVNQTGTALGILRLLAIHAQAHTRHSFAPCRWDGRIALFAMRHTGTFLQLASRALDRIIDRRIDLVLHCAIACPTGGHGAS
jgi:hypothetical protein